jgi:hypothetical protein
MNVEKMGNLKFVLFTKLKSENKEGRDHLETLV